MANIVIAGDSWAWTWEYWHGTFPILEDDEGYQLQTPIYTYVLSDSGDTLWLMLLARVQATKK